MAAPKSRINTEFYNKNTIELELKGSNFNGVFIWQGHKDLNPEPTVLETAALPIELYPYIQSMVGLRGLEPGTVRL